MPIYEYECSNCRYYLEVIQKFSDARLKKCPSCGKSALTRLISAPVFRLKGSGWYETDFKGDAEKKRNLAAAEKDESSGVAKDAKDTKEGKDGSDAKDAKDVKAGAADATAEAKPAAAKEPKSASADGGGGARKSRTGKRVSKGAASRRAASKPKAGKRRSRR
ncbi:MAG TPA: zinc ribbon domain-containing protein [Steroidobacteraceae bacterium]|jgi:putative FmdB family regulatory protein